MYNLLPVLSTWNDLDLYVASYDQTLLWYGQQTYKKYREDVKEKQKGDWMYGRNKRKIFNPVILSN